MGDEQNAAAFDLPLARPPRNGRLPRREDLPLSDGAVVSVYVHAPTGSVRRRPVVYLHGIQSHPGWFVASAAELAAAGHPVFQITRRGSGDCRQVQGDCCSLREDCRLERGRCPQLPGDAASAKQLLDDVATACRYALRDGADGVHLVGVSWGGKLAACFAADGAAGLPVHSLTLVAPGIVPQVDVPLTTKLSIALALLAAPQRRFDIPLSDPALFTDHEPMLQFLRNDPRRLHRATARFLYASRQLDVMLRRAAKKAGCHGRLRPCEVGVSHSDQHGRERPCHPSESGEIPVTLILAERDRIIDNDRTTKLLRRLAEESLNVQTLPGCHTLEFEPDSQPLYDALIAAVVRGESL